MSHGAIDRELLLVTKRGPVRNLAIFEVHVFALLVLVGISDITGHHSFLLLLAIIAAHAQRTLASLLRRRQLEMSVIGNAPVEITSKSKSYGILGPRATWLWWYWCLLRWRGDCCAMSLHLPALTTFQCLPARSFVGVQIRDGRIDLIAKQKLLDPEHRQSKFNQLRYEYRQHTHRVLDIIENDLDRVSCAQIE